MSIKQYEQAAGNGSGDFSGNMIQFNKRFSDDLACRRYLEAKRWPNGPVCPHCKANGSSVYSLNGTAHRPGLYKCGACRKQFTVTMGTIFEDSHLPLSKWFAAYFLMCSSKKGISAKQLQRMLGGSYGTWWFVSHRIRSGMRTRAFRNTLSGIVEADETYVGGRSRGGKRGRGAAGKTIVFGMVQRGGDVHAQAVPDVRKSTIQPIIASAVEPGSHVMTDQLNTYNRLSELYDHSVVFHSRDTGEYAAPGGINVNTAESFWALLKRGVMGTFHHIGGGEKADNYLGEFGFRFNTRTLTDAQRFTEAIAHCDGRLTWNFGRGVTNGHKETQAQDSESGGAAR